MGLAHLSPKKQKKEFQIPFSPLQEPLINRLSQLVDRELLKGHGLSRILHLLGKMKNVDHRKEWRLLSNVPAEDTSSFGRRVRELKVTRNFPSTRLVVKRVHGLKTAFELVKHINSLVDSLNSSGKMPFFLAHIPAVAISKDFIVMPFINAPNIEEIIGQASRRTARGKAMLGRLKKAGIPENNFRDICNAALLHFFDAEYNLICVGVKNRKPIFMQLADEY